MRQLVPAKLGWYVQVQPTSKERNEWNSGKKRRQEGRNNYHHEVERDMVKEEESQGTSLGGPHGVLYRRAACVGTGSVLRQRSDENAKPVFLMCLQAKRFQSLPKDCPVFEPGSSPGTERDTGMNGRRSGEKNLVCVAPRSQNTAHGTSMQEGRRPARIVRQVEGHRGRCNRDLS